MTVNKIAEALYGRGWGVEDIKPDPFNLCSKSWRDPNSGKEYSYDWGHPGGLEREFEILSKNAVKERKHETMKKNTYSLVIKNVIFNPPATIVFWDDGDKTVVKCGKDEPFDPEKGLAMAIAKRVLGQHGSYYNHIKKWTKSYNDKMDREKEAAIDDIFKELTKEMLKGNETTD